MADEADRLFERYQRAGAPEDLAAVFDRCAFDLLKVAMHVCPTDGEAEDLVQQTFVVAISCAKRYRSGESVRAWLLGILRNLARDHRKRTRRRPEPERLRTPTEPDPGDLLSRAEVRATFESALANMPLPYREVAELRLVHGLRATEIARRLERSPGTVRTQCYRAMEILRSVLPASLGGLLAAHLSATRGLAALRVELVARAETTTLTTTTGWIGALLAMKTYLTIGVGAGIAAALWLAWPGDDPDVPTDVPGLAAAQERVSPSETQRSGADDRTAPPATRAVASDPAREPVRVPPYRVRVLVVDADGDPVRGATVEVWAAQRVLFTPGGQGGSSSTGASPTGTSWAYQGREPDQPPILRCSTDAAGTCTFEIDRELCKLSAHKLGVGRSGDSTVTPVHAAEPLRVVLRPVTVVSGRVLDATGQPAPGVDVISYLIGGSTEVAPVPPPATHTDREGRFELDLGAGSSYRILARKAGDRSDPVEVHAQMSGSTLEIELQLPGAFALGGFVTTPDGKPLGHGKIEAWISGTRAVSLRGTDVNDGRFDLPLTRPGRYVVRATAQGFALSPSVPVELTRTIPATQVSLQLEHLATIEGLVTTADGTPIRCSLKAWRQSPEGPIETTDPCVATSGSDGRFRITGTHPSYRYTIVCIPDRERPQVQHREEGIAGNATGLALRLDPRLLQSARVRGVLTDGRTGAPIPRFKVELLAELPNGVAEHGVKDIDAADGSFAVEGLAPGKRYILRIRAPGQLPVLTGPFEVTEAEPRLFLKTPVPGTVVCQVRGEDSAPAAGVLVTPTLQAPLAWLVPPVRQVTDASGRVELSLAPGRYKILVRPNGAPGLQSREVEVAAASHQVIEITLAKR